MDFAAPKRMLGWLQRTLFAGLKDPTKQQTGLEAYVDGAGVWYGVTAHPTTGVHQWTPKGGPGYVAGQRYYFSDAANGTDGPRGLYAGPEAALAAALADGHGKDAPATLLGYPGVYALARTLALPEGLSLESVAADASPWFGGSGAPTACPVRLVGNVTCTVAADGWIRVAGVQIDGTLVATGAGTGGVVWSDVVVNATGVAAGATNQFATQGNGLYARNCTFQTDGTAQGARAFWAAAGSYSALLDCSLVNAGNRDALLVNGGSTVSMFGVTYVNGTITTGAGANLIFGETIHVNWPGTNAITLSATSAMQVMDLVSAGTAGTLVTGTGALVWQRPQTEAGNPGTLALGTGVVVATVYAPRFLKSARGAGPDQTIPADCDVYYVDTGDAATVVRFPDLATCSEGVRVTVKALNALGAITLTPFAGQRLDLGAADATQNLAASANGAVRTFVADRVAVPPVWRSITP